MPEALPDAQLDVCHAPMPSANHVRTDGLTKNFNYNSVVDLSVRNAHAHTAISMLLIGFASLAMTTLTRSPHGLDSGPDVFWQARAACAGRYDLFDSDRWVDHQRAAHLCNTHCPVLAECTAAAKTGPRWYGVLAGMIAGWRIPPDPGCGPHCAVDRFEDGAA